MCLINTSHLHHLLSLTTTTLVLLPIHSTILHKMIMLIQLVHLLMVILHGLITLLHLDMGDQITLVLEEIEMVEDSDVTLEVEELVLDLASKAIITTSFLLQGIKITYNVNSARNLVIWLHSASTYMYLMTIP